VADENDFSPIGVVMEYEIMIRESHLDTFGHVNNAAYLQILEEARWDFITARGYGLKEVFESKQGPTILEVTLRFQRELKNREKIKIRSWSTGQSGKVSTLRQVMINSKNEEACIADFKFALFDLNLRKIIAPTDAWKKAIGLT
jgi:YbgC/YbaW family acyl-CoA thioester hydrolase